MMRLACHGSTHCSCSGNRFGSGCRESFFAENRGDLMLPMTVARSPAEAQYNHVGAESPDHPHDIAEDLVVSAPFFKRFLGRLTEPEIDRPREKLLSPIHSSRPHKF